MKRKIAAIVAADVAGYSRLVSDDEEDTIRRLAAYREVYDDVIAQYGGRIFNTAGDSVLSEFESAVEAVRSAIDIQDALRTRNLDLPAHRKLQFRIGISIGDVIERNGDLLGDGVNIAARLESLAEPGGICVSRSVHEAVANKISVPFRDLGERQVKNIPQPIHAFEVSLPGSDGSPARRAPVRAGRSRLTLIMAAGVVLALAVIAMILVHPMFGTSFRSPVAADTPGQTARSEPRPASTPPRPDGLVTDPRTAAELDHNARLLESRGDLAGARRAYDAILRLGLELIDPGLRYASLLRVQDGRAAARETFADIDRDKPTIAASLVHALQFDGAERQSRVAAIAAQHPDYPPALYLLGEEASEDRLGRAPTIAERTQALEAYRGFLKADADGRLTTFFVDLSVLASWLDRARTRVRALETLARSGAERTGAQFMRSNAGWTATITLPEAALALRYRIGQTGDFTSAGDSGVTDPRTGRPMPDTSIALPADQGPTTLWVRYTDAAGRETEPVPIGFDPHAALVATQRRSLEVTSGAWLAFRRDWDNLLYYTQLVSFRCAIRQAFIGLDDAPVDRALVLPPCDERDPYAMPADTKPYLTIPKTTRSVSVRLIYADGTASDVKTVRR